MISEQVMQNFFSSTQRVSEMNPRASKNFHFEFGFNFWKAMSAYLEERQFKPGRFVINGHECTSQLYGFRAKKSTILPPNYAALVDSNGMAIKHFKLKVDDEVL